MSMALGAFLAGVLLAELRVPARARDRHRAVQGPAAGPLLHRRRHDHRLRSARAPAAHDRRAGRGLPVAEGRRSARCSGKALGIPQGQRWLFAALLAQGGEFAFVVFGARGRRALLPGAVGRAPRRWSVALSMALTPLLLLGDRSAGGAQRPARRGRTTRSSPKGAPVIIAGFGRFGQIVGRLLFAQRHARDGARPRRRPDRAAAQVRLQRVLRRRDAARSAAHRRRGGGQRAGRRDRRHRRQHRAGRRSRASTSRTSPSWRARATSRTGTSCASAASSSSSARRSSRR